MINFMGWKKLYGIISALVIIPGVVSLVLFGLRPSIDFSGGTELEFRLSKGSQQTPSSEQLKQVRATIKDKLEVVDVQAKRSSVLVQAKAIDLAKKNEVVDQLKTQFADVEVLRYETIGPIIGKELLIKTITAIVLSAGGILYWVARRFKEWRYGVCAILATLHDTLVVFGVFSILGHFLSVEVDILFVTAVLTILSFSVHDTIVVYDRIRELRHKHPRMEFAEIINTAVTETLSRSLNNSMTIIFMLLALWLLGGETIHWFAFALLVGTITGTYSSTFVAAPLLVVWNELEMKKRKR